MKYVAPTLMAEYRQRLEKFAKGAKSLRCIRSHYFPDRSGRCDLTGAKEQEEIFVLSNRVEATLKVSPFGMQVVANVLDIEGADEWYQHLKDQRKAEKLRQEEVTQKREEAKNASRVVLFKKKPVDLLKKNEL